MLKKITSQPVKNKNMKTLKIVLIAMVVLVGGAAIWLATLNGRYDVTRTIFIAAPQETVFNQVADYKTWPNWGPWFSNDSTLTPSYGETTTGVGGTYSWVSDNSGNGKMEFIEVTPHSALASQVTFEDMGGGTDYWIFEPKEGGTQVTWGFKGEMPFFFRFMAAQMDAGIGPDYEKGLAKLKENLELLQPKVAVGKKVLQPTTMYYIDYDLGFEEITPEWYANGYHKILVYLGKDAALQSGAPMAIHYTWDTETKRTVCALAIPCASDKPGVGDIKRGETFAGKTIFVSHKGPRENLIESHEALEKYMEANNITYVGPAIEVYVTDTSTQPDTAQWLTEVYYGVK